MEAASDPLIRELDTLRKRIAAENDIVPESVLPRGAIKALCATRPTSLEDSVAVVGIARVSIATLYWHRTSLCGSLADTNALLLLP